MPMQETEPLTNSRRLNQSIRGWIQKAIDSLARIPFRTLVLGVILMISADFIHRNIVQFKETSDEALCARTIRTDEEKLLYGFYCVTDVDGPDASASAQMTRSGDGLRLVVYSDYEPVSYSLSLLSSGILYCEELGEGTIQYKPSIGTVNIKFTKAGKELCELSK